MSAVSTTVLRSSFMPGASTPWRDIRWRHRYRDITSISPQGRFLLDYTKFDDVVPEEA